MAKIYCLLLAVASSVILGLAQGHQNNFLDANELNNRQSNFDDWKNTLPSCTSDIYVVSNESATIESQNGKDCAIEISPATSNVIVHLSFGKFDLKDNGTCKNFIRVHSGCTMKTLCGKDGADWTFSTRETVSFSYNVNDVPSAKEFTNSTDYNSMDMPHFELIYQNIEKACDSWSKSLSSGQKEFIKSHSKFDGGMTKYTPTENCRWDIEVSQNKVPEIKFTYFMLGNNSSCDGDVVKVWTGNSPADTLTDPDFEFCGMPKHLPAVTGRGKYMTVTFETDESNENGGFSAEILEREMECPQLNNDVVNLKFLPGYGVSCQWNFNDSINLTFSELYLRDGDSIIIYRTKDMSKVSHINKANMNRRNTVAIQGNFSMIMEFTSTPALPNEKFGISFKAVKNCANHETYYSSSKMTWQQAENHCKNRGPGWNLIETDTQCKAAKHREDLQRESGRFDIYWIGISMDREGIWRWSNGNIIPKSFQHWYGREPNGKNDNERCGLLAFFNDKIFWNDVACGNTARAICSRLKQ